MTRKRLEVSDDVKLHLEEMKKKLAGFSNQRLSFATEGGCGEQCMLTCAHYCHSACETYCNVNCSQGCVNGCATCAVEDPDLLEWWTFPGSI